MTNLKKLVLYRNYATRNYVDDEFNMIGYLGFRAAVPGTSLAVVAGPIPLDT